ncbi:MAG: hypothetical protein JKY37_29850 [Nannocystaceae bacterium]|nr:hypothetical protein [Nannocystaceae bacterium]
MILTRSPWLLSSVLGVAVAASACSESDDDGADTAADSGGPGADDDGAATGTGSSPDDDSDSDNDDADGDDPDDGESGDDGDDEGVAVGFAEVYAVMSTYNCGNGYCHGGASSGGLSFDSEDAAYDALVGVVATTSACDMQLRVSSADPSTSIMLQRIDPTQAVDAECFGVMPPDSKGLAAADAAIVRAWIAGGAVR